MNHYLAVFTGSPRHQRRLWAGTPSERTQRNARIQAGMQAWGAWMTTHAAQIVVAGGPSARRCGWTPRRLGHAERDLRLSSSQLIRTRRAA